jgi:hypothetical protein
VILNALLDGLRFSRQRFLAHLKDLPDSAWTYKPFPEGKNILETLVHLRIDDDMAAESILTKKEPDYEAATVGAYEEMANGPEFLLNRLADSHRRLLELLKSEFGELPMAAEICIWGHMMPVYQGIPFLSSEDFYHAGQVAYVRMAVQPDWDYYAAIYGE